MTKLVLVDSRVADIAQIASSIAPNTEIITFNFIDDSFESLKAKITASYESICIAQHNYKYSTVKLLNNMPEGIIKNVETEDPNLTTWEPIIDFFIWLKTQAGCQYIDLLACNIWADSDWRYAILKLREITGAYIRASVNITGAGGDFILESDNVDLIGIYFTENINNYKYQFAYFPIGLTSPHFANNPPIALPNGGTINLTDYVSLVGSMTGCSTGLAGTTYIDPPTDMSNIVNFVYTSDQGIPCAYAGLTSTGKVFTFGRNLHGGDSSSVASTLSGGIIKVIATNQAFCALHSNGTAVCWGQFQGLSVNTTGNANIIPASSVNLTNCKDIYASGSTFVALKNDGTVVMWGYCKTWSYPTSSLVGIVKIKELYPLNYAFVALRNDGHAVMWGPNASITSLSLVSTSPIIDVYSTDYACVIVRADRTVYKNFSDIVEYTLPAGRTVLDVYSIYNSGFDFAMLLDDRTLYLSSNKTTYSNVSQFVGHDSAYAFIQNGGVVAFGDWRFGGSITDPTNGVPSGQSVSSGVVKIACSSASMCALKSNGTVVVWGANAGGRSAATAVQSQLVNVVNIVDVWTGYIAITSDNKLISWGENNNRWYGTPSSSFSSSITLPAGRNVALLSAFQSVFIVDIPNTSMIFPSIVRQYQSNTITYNSATFYKYAIPGRKYALYSGSTLLATYNPIFAGYTFTFKNVQFSTNGTISCSIIDYTDVSNTIYTFNITVNPEVQTTPSPAVIKTLVNENNTITAVVSTDINVQNVKLSIDGGSTYSTYTSSVVSSLSVNTPGFSIATGTTGMSALAYNNESGIKLFAIDSARNKLMAVKCNLSAVSLVDVANAPASAKSIAITTDGSKGIICNSNYCYSINGSLISKQIGDTISRNYKAVDITSTGNRIVAMADNLYYGVWIDSIQTFGQLSLANGEITSGTCLALSPDGFIVAYSTSSGIKYSFWTGNGYTSGTIIGNTPSSPVAMRFAPNGNVLICSALVGSTPSLFYTYWNGSTFGIWVNLNVSFGLSNASPTGLCIDSNNQIYASCTGVSSVMRWQMNLLYESITNNNLVKLTNGVSSASNYNVVAQSVSSAGTSVAGGVTDFSSDGNSLTINFTLPITSDTILKYSYSIDNVVFYDISASDMTTGTGVISSGFPSAGLSILSLFLRVHYATNGVQYIGSLTKTSPVIINAAPQMMSIITGITGKNTSLEVSFTNAIPNGQTVVKYQYSVNGGSFVDVSPDSAANGIFTITGLTNGTAYNIQMRTITNIITSALSNTISGTPFNPVPPVPPTVTAVAVASKQATVTYSAGSGNTILYNEYSIDGGSTYIPFSPNYSNFKIYGLTNGVSTNVLVRTVAANGTSSTSSYSLTAKDIAMAPTITGVAAGNQQLVVYVVNSELNGGTITGYLVSLNGGAFNSVSSGNILTTGTDSEITLTGLTNGSTYNIAVKTITDVGTSPSSVLSKGHIPYTSPAVPVIDSITSINSGIRINFTLPSNNTGGKPIIGYKCRLNGIDERWVYSSPAVIVDLSNGIDYTVEMQAVNTSASSAYSSASSSVVPFNVPSAPVITKILPGDGKAYVYFNDLQLNGSPLVKLQYNLGSAWIDASGSSSPLTIYGLTNKSFYNIFIKAFNNAGESYPSNIIQVLVGSPQPPEITDVIFGNKQLTVKFNMPMNNGLIKSVMGGVSTNPSVAPVMAKLVAAPLITDTSFTVVIPKLTNGFGYYVKLQLVNAVGSSAYSSMVGPIIPAAIPSPVIISNVVVNSANSALIYFPPAINNGDAIQKYMYSIGISGEKIDLSGLSSPFIISDLSVNTSYTFVVYSKNKAGISLPSKPSKAFLIKYVIPPAPSKLITSAYRDPSSTLLSPVFYMNVSFTAPVVNALTPITTYKYIVSTSSGSTSIIDANTTTLPLKIQINPNIAYSVKVIATNIVGDSSHSLPSAPITTVFLPPFPPVIKTITQDSSNSVVIAFTSGTLRGVPVIKYQYTVNSGTTYVDMATNASGNLVATDLSRNVSISTFQIVALTAIGQSARSVAAKPFTILYNVPSAPVLSAPVISGSTATIGFSTPLSNGSPITGYSITTTYMNAGKLISVITEYFASSPIALTGLTSGNYSVIVRAINEIGQSAPSAPKTFSISG